MTKGLFSKLYFTVLITIIFSMIIITSNVKAISDEGVSSVLEEVIEEDTINTEENVYVEEKIMRYDAKTNTETEVDMEELKQVYATLRSKNVNNSLSIDSIEPSKKKHISNNFSNKDNYSFFSNNRQRIGDTSILPYSAVCRIIFSDPSSDSGKSLGSGTLVAKNALLTCAHCVFDKKNNNSKFKDWIAYPAYNGAPYKNLSTGWSSVYYSSAWKSNHSYEYDWALCILENNVGATVGAVGLQSYETASEMKNLNIRTLRLSSKWRFF